MQRMGFTGIGLDVPDGWDGCTRVETGGIPVVHTANFSLSAGDDMPADLSQQKLGHGDVLITLWEYPREKNQPTEVFTPLTAPLEIGPTNFGRFEGVEAPAYALRVFSLGDHLLQVGVSFGDENPTWKAITAVNTILGTLTTI